MAGVEAVKVPISGGEQLAEHAMQYPDNKAGKNLLECMHVPRVNGVEVNVMRRGAVGKGKCRGGDVQ